jgi:hypothetical protein
MKYLRILAEAAIMAGGLLLVIITLSGQTRDTAIIISIASVIVYILSQLVPSDD